MEWGWRGFPLCCFGLVRTGGDRRDQRRNSGVEEESRVCNENAHGEQGAIEQHDSKLDQRLLCTRRHGFNHATSQP